MRHYHLVTLDNQLRCLWFNQGLFGLSEALKASARNKPSRIVSDVQGALFS